MSGRWYSYREFFPRSTPRQAKGGIKAQSQRGTFGESWWAQRWIAVLESFQIGARLGRGRSYARHGQVLSIDIQPGAVTAKVQGSRPTPYGITIKLKPIPAAGWKKLARTLGQQAVFAAKLLAGEMPQDIEKTFQAASLSLFPEKLKDLVTDCSCPDWSNPCKHIAAVYYLLGEEFDRDPFLIFKLRGMTREELVGLLGDSGTAGADEPPPAQTTVDTPPARGGRRRQRQAVTSPQSAGADADRPGLEASSPSEPLPHDAAAFWCGASLPDQFFGEVRAPALAAALPRRLGSFPFWRAAERLLDALEPIYREASPIGLDVFLGQAAAAHQSVTTVNARGRAPNRLG